MLIGVLWREIHRFQTNPAYSYSDFSVSIISIVDNGIYYHLIPGANMKRNCSISPSVDQIRIDQTWENSFYSWWQTSFTTWLILLGMVSRLYTGLRSFVLAFKVNPFSKNINNVSYFLVIYFRFISIYIFVLFASINYPWKWYASFVRLIHFILLNIYPPKFFFIFWYSSRFNYNK